MIEKELEACASSGSFFFVQDASVGSSRTLGIVESRLWMNTWLPLLAFPADFHRAGHIYCAIRIMQGLCRTAIILLLYFAKFGKPYSASSMFIRLLRFGAMPEVHLMQPF